MTKQKLWYWGFYTTLVGMGVFGLTFVTTATMIGMSVKQQCMAVALKGDCVTGLMGLVQDEEKSYQERNRAIWALGQLGDKRALPLLISMYTGVISEREPYDGGISQYELKKAINLAGGGVNLTAWLWR